MALGYHDRADHCRSPDARPVHRGANASGELRTQLDPHPPQPGMRLVTTLVVQDGGLVGAIFNLVALAAIGVAGSRYGVRSGGPSLPQCSAINRSPPNSGLLAD